MTSSIEKHYQAKMASLSPKERVERCAAMLKWTRELLGRQITAEQGPMSAERLKWAVARRMYAADAKAVAMIDRILADVSP